MPNTAVDHSRFFVRSFCVRLFASADWYPHVDTGKRRVPGVAAADAPRKRRAGGTAPSPAVPRVINIDAGASPQVICSWATIAMGAGA